jgi:hypothetical protein
MSKQFKAGDRVKGLGNYQGKTGIVYRIKSPDILIVQWNNNPFRISVNKNEVEVCNAS